MPFLSHANRYNPARWIRESVSPGEDPREFWLGRQYKPPEPGSPELRLEGGEEQRRQLQAMYERMGAYDPGYGSVIEGLRAQASGQGVGAGERAAARAGERQLAALRAQANTARGFGAGTSRVQAMDQLAAMRGQAQGQAAAAAMDDRERARAALMGALGQQNQAQIAARSMQMQALAAQMGISQAELEARLRMQQLQAAAAAADEGAAGRLLAAGGTVAPLL